MRDHQIIRGFENHDQAINRLRAEQQALGKAADRIYVRSLTHEMMWDVLMGLLESKGMITRTQFDEALKELSDKTKAAMEAEAKKKAEESLPAEGKVAVLSEVPAIPVQ